MTTTIWNKPVALALSVVFCAAAAKVVTSDQPILAPILDQFGFPLDWGPSPFVPCETLFIKASGCFADGSVSERDVVKRQVSNPFPNSPEAQQQLADFAREQFDRFMNSNDKPVQKLLSLHQMLEALGGFENAGKLGMSSGQLEKLASEMVNQYLDGINNALFKENLGYDDFRDLTTLANNLSLSETRLDQLLKVGLNDRGLNTQDVIAKYEREATSFIQRDPDAPTSDTSQEWTEVAEDQSRAELLLDVARSLGEFQQTLHGNMTPEVSQRLHQLENIVAAQSDAQVVPSKPVSGVVKP